MGEKEPNFENSFAGIFFYNNKSMKLENYMESTENCRMYCFNKDSLSQTP